jgi:threonine aldolase
MIDLQSDLVNLPTDEMWHAMRQADLSWAVGRDNQSVNRLEKKAAELMGKESALFILTGRMACLIALMSLCERGNQVILEKNSHIAWSQERGLAYICGLYPRLVDGDAGVMNPEEIEAVISESRFKNTPPTDLLCLENTHNMGGGTVLTHHHTKLLCDVAHRHGAKVFIDGCRIFYAAAALETEPSKLVASADAVVFSLIKGICGHGGALLCGTTSDIESAYLNLKRIGAASFHRAGMLAASGLVALDTMVNRLKEDIYRAKSFAEQLNEITGIKVNLKSVQTNIVMADISESGFVSREFIARLKEKEVLAHQLTPKIIRFTFHRHISDNDVDKALNIIGKIVLDK